MALRRPPFRPAALTRAAASAALGVLTLWFTAHAAGPAAPPDRGRAAAPLPVEPARNPLRLLLQDDGRQVVGWVSGTADLAGRGVSVAVAGADKAAAVVLDKGNTFAWPHEGVKPAEVTFAVAVPGAGTLTERLTLAAPPAEEGPTAFFVVDRTAYRPGQTFHFAAFLRKPDARGEFAPVAGREFEVRLASEKKNTTAFKVKATSDDFGRVTGSYAFTEADALDHYALSIPGVKGSARVLLGEYRKSKTRLKVGGKVTGEKLKLTFEVLDFLEKRVPATRASFTAQVVRADGRGKTATLKGEEFAYHTPLDALVAGWDNLSEDETLLWQAEGPAAALLAPSGGNAVVAGLTGDVEMRGREVGEHLVDLKKEWLAGGHSLVVAAVVTDANGREQRSTQSIPIGEPRCPGVTLELGRALVRTGERVTVRAVRAGKDEAKDHAFDGPLALVVMRLSPGDPAGAAFDPYGYGMYSQHLSANYIPNGYGYRRRGFLPFQPAEAVKRAMVTAVPFGRDDGATVRLTEPGAYKLVAVGQREDGSSVRTEVGLVVRAAEDLPALTLKLDKEEVGAGGPLAGTITSKYAGARVLLTVRDAAGLRLWKPLTLGADGTLRLEEALPAGLRYGCEVEVQYPDLEDRTRTATKFVRVLPTDRTLTVTPTVKPTVAPGETVKVDLRVDRQEEVDLVVSVYDASLLGIAPDKSVDVRNFYLADERVRLSRGRDLLRRRLGNLALEPLVTKAEALLAADRHLIETPEGQQLQWFASQARANRLYSGGLAAVLRLAGVEAVLQPGLEYHSGNVWLAQIPAALGLKTRLAGLLDQECNGWRLVPLVVNDAIVLTLHHPNGTPPGWQDPNANTLQFYGGYGGRRAGNRLARADAQWSASGNSVHSVEGQGFVSHLPAGGAASPLLLDTDPGQAHIGVRRDFSDSAFWNARVRTDRTGHASVEFKVPDSLTNWQVVVTAVSPRMHVGQGRATFRTFKPVMVWPMLPRVFTEGDRVELFASVHNRTAEPQRITVKLKADNGEVLTAAERVADVPALGNVPVYWTFRAGKAGFTQLLMTADCPAGNDASLKRLPVSPAAAVEVVTAAGTVRDGTTFEVPAGVDRAASSLEVSFAPSLAADMADTLNYLVDYPYGCVEQTMSRFLPAIKVAQVLQNFDIDHPELRKKLPGCVAGGLKRLLELQQPDGGWAWHGAGQTHEMMTPYALYGLLQAEKAGYQIPNEQAVERGLARLLQFINGMNEAQTADRVYCVYVYAHRREVEKPWWDFLADRLKADKLSDYALALSLELAVQKGQKELAGGLANKLRARAQKLGAGRFWQTAGFSRWADDRFEVTAAVMKALVAYDRTDPLVDGALAFFAATKRGDRWNSTKDTAMILYAMCDYLAKERFDPKAKKDLTFAVNGGEARLVRFENKLTQKVVLPGELLKEGVNQLTFKTATAGMMYRLVYRYWRTGAALKPSDEGIGVTRAFYLLDGKGGVTRRLKSGDAVPRGSYVLSEVVAANRLPHDMQYVLVENPKPAGAEVVPADDARFAGNAHCTPYVLREERTASVAFHHEATPQTLNDRCVLLAELAGEFVVPPAHVEMMYWTEHRGHSGTFVLKVTNEEKK